MAVILKSPIRLLLVCGLVCGSSSLSLLGSPLSARADGADKDKPAEQQLAAKSANSSGADSAGGDQAKDKSQASGSTGGAGDLKADIADLKSEQIQLRRMGEAVKRTKKAAVDIVVECTQPIEMMGEIDIIGQDIIPIMPQTAEGFGNQYMPPRSKYINLHMAQLVSLVPILKDDIEQLKVPASEKDFAQKPLEDLNGYVNDINLHLKKLHELTDNTSDYERLALMNEAKGIDDACRGIESARKKLLHEEARLERKEEKQEKQLEKGNN